MIGYCPTERKKVEIQDPVQLTTVRGKPAVKGRCPSCGREISRLGRLSEVDDGDPKRSHSNIRGEAGEHYVLFRLMRSGVVVAGQAPRGTKDYDLLVDGKLKVQVKTRTKPKWSMKERHADVRDRHLFYAFVELAQQPTTYVIPSGVVAELVRKIVDVYDHPPYISIQNSFGKWAERLGCPDGWMNRYEDRWDYLGADA